MQSTVEEDPGRVQLNIFKREQDKISPNHMRNKPFSGPSISMNAGKKLRQDDPFEEPQEDAHMIIAHLVPDFGNRFTEQSSYI